MDQVTASRRDCPKATVGVVAGAGLRQIGHPLCARSEIAKLLKAYQLRMLPRGLSTGLCKGLLTAWLPMCMSTLLVGLISSQGRGGTPVAIADMSIEPLLTIEPGEGNPRNSEGDVIELTDGHLCLVYTRFTGGGSDHAAADLAMRISQDKGRTWGDDRIVVRRTGGLNVMSVSLLRLANGEIALFYLRKTSTEDCRPLMCTSVDESRTWSQPTVCITDEVGYYVLNNDRAVQLKSGRLILPVAWHQGPGQDRDSAGVIMCYLSDDCGKTWRRSKSPFKGYDPDGRRITVQEPGVLELEDGRLMMYMRTNAGSQYVCHSFDEGETWSKAGPSALMSPLSPATIERIPWTGDLLCIWNDHSGSHPYPPGRRTPLCMAISQDEGESWRPSRIIEDDPDGWYCYTSVTFLRDSVLLTYCAGDRTVGGLNRLRVVAIGKDSFTPKLTPLRTSRFSAMPPPPRPPRNDGS